MVDRSASPQSQTWNLHVYHTAFRAWLRSCLQEPGGTPEQLCHPGLTPAWVMASPELQKGSLPSVNFHTLYLLALPRTQRLCAAGAELHTVGREGRHGWASGEAGVTLLSLFYEEMSIIF